MADQKYQTTCCYCGVGCGIIASKADNGMIDVEGNPSHPVNKGMLCSKGMNLHYTVNDRRERLLYPEMRYNKNLPRQRVSWDQALERTAAVFRTMIDQYGPDSVAFYASGQCLTEEYYVVNKLAKGFIGTNNIDTNSRLCMSSAVVGYKMSLGEDSVPVSYDDIELADVIFVAGANPAWCHPILWRRVEAAKEKNPDLKIIVSDPRKTHSCAIADLHIQLNPGTDVVFHYAIGRYLIEHGYIDPVFIGDHTEGIEAYQQKVFSATIAEAALICGIEELEIAKAARMIGEARGFLSMWTMGLNQSVIGVSKNLSLINLHLITGQIGKPGAGPFSLTGQPNAMGGREVGGLSNLLPAHRDLSKPEDRLEVEKFWSITSGKISATPGLTATEMFEALQDEKLKAIWIMCTNPLVSLPDVRKAEAALLKAKFVVVQEVSSNPETLAFADVVLPAAAWAEKEGTMTNGGRYISHLSKILEPPGEALPDAEIICRFAQKMGFDGFDFAEPSEIFAEHAALTRGTNIDIADLNYDILKKNLAVQWPYKKGQSANGTSRLFTDRRFFTRSGQAQIRVLDEMMETEKPSEQYPLILTTGRIRDQWHTMTKTGRVSKLKQHIGEAFLEIHPLDAAERSISDGSIIVLTSPRGEVRVKAKLSADIKSGVVFMPIHWGKIMKSDLHRVNNVTLNAVDQWSKEPGFKYAAVEVKPYQKPRQKIVVIGAGAGACGFVQSFRTLNMEDDIEIFSLESQPFYNRVLLPDYISGVLNWSNLIKMTEEEEEAYRIKLHRGVSIVHIDREAKRVKDSFGVEHSYDLLIMATGSRAITLKDVPDMNGIFTMRSRHDADRFLSHLRGVEGRVLVIGGGLLGIELAASLRESGKEVTILQRISRLMDRQLDPLASQLLHEELISKGIDIIYNDEADRFMGGAAVEGVLMKSGVMVECKSIVIAIGTIPNIELAVEAGLHCKRGVTVDAYLRSNDKSVFAIGEIAAFEGSLFGITAAAEQQAEVVARFICGDISAPYQGSLLMNILKVHGTDICSLGMTEAPINDPAYEEVIFLDRAKRYYKKCIVYQDRLVGAILIGDKQEFLTFKNLIESKMELSETRLRLLRSGQKAEAVLGRIVCSCSQVGEGNITKCIQEGCTDLLQLCQITGAGMGCGSCRPEVKNILDGARRPTILDIVKKEKLYVDDH